MMTLPNECIHGRAIKGADDPHECIYCANNRLRAEVAALRADAERLDALGDALFERKWDGTIGRPCDWYLVGPWRHWVQRMRGDTFRDAIDAALAKEGK